MKDRIVHIVKATGIHGTEKHLLTLLSGLGEKYHVFLIVLTEPKIPLDDYFTQLAENGIHAYPVVIRSDLDLSCVWKIYQVIKKVKPVLVHTHLIHGDIYGTLAAGAAGAGCIVSTKHNDDRFRKNRFIRAINMAVNKKTSGVIAISDWVRNFITTVEAVPEKKSRTIYYGLKDFFPEKASDTIREEFNISREAVVVGIIARLVAQKDHQTLIAAFAAARRENSRLVLLIAGDGKLKSVLQQQVKTAGLEKAVVFTGYRVDTEKILEAIDIFAHPSRWEGFGLSILEAMVMAKPVLATRVSAIPELVQDNETGFLVPAGEPDVLSQKILALTENPELRKRLGRNGRERWKKLFSADKMIAETENYYEKLLSDRL